MRWQHIKDLYELQDKDSLKTTSKLKRGHIEWFQQKMKVSLAAQSLSNSVVSSLDFLSKLSKFTDVQTTVNFIHIMDQLFDVLKSKNPFTKDFKSVMRPSNEHIWRPFFKKAYEYLVGLKLGGTSLHQRRQGRQ